MSIYLAKMNTAIVTHHHFMLQDETYYGHGNTEGTWGKNGQWEQRCFSCPENCGLFLTLAEIKQPRPASSSTTLAADQRITQLERQLRAKTQETEQLSSSEGRLRMEVAELQGHIARLQGEVRATVDRLQREVRNRQTALQDQLTDQRDQHTAQLQQMRGQVERYQRLWRDEQAQHQQLATRINTAMAHLRGETAPPQEALQLWELPREEVHISKTILGTGAWGYVARGTFQGQAVAVKCLHQGSCHHRMKEG